MCDPDTDKKCWCLDDSKYSNHPYCHACQADGTNCKSCVCSRKTLACYTSIDYVKEQIFPGTTGASGTQGVGSQGGRSVGSRGVPGVGSRGVPGVVTQGVPGQGNQSSQRGSESSSSHGMYSFRCLVVISFLTDICVIAGLYAAIGVSVGVVGLIVVAVIIYLIMRQK